MQNRNVKNVVKATIGSVIVAFFIIMITCYIALKLGREKILMATNFIDMITVNKTYAEEKVSPILQPFTEENVEENQESSFVLLNCPDYGENYAKLKIAKIGVELPIYYGKTLDLLKNGVGHDNDSYFPGEGGSIVLMGHNFSRFLAKLPQVQVGDLIEIDTNYGNFQYTVYDAQIVNENDTDKVPIQEKEEILMIYTCWPIHNIGYATERYVVYAK